MQERQQFMITALLQTLKQTPGDDLTNLLRLVRESSQPNVLAECHQEHFTALQTKTCLPKFTFDKSDVDSFVLQGLGGHRKDRARPSSALLKLCLALHGAQG